MKIILVYPSRNRRLWVLIFLLSMWAGCELRATRADQTHYTSKQWLDTRDVLDEKWERHEKTWELLYGTRKIKEERPPSIKGKEKKHTGTTVPASEQTPHPDKGEGWRSRARKHPPSQSRAARSLALPIPTKDARRSYYPAYAGSSGQRTLHQKTGSVSLRG